MDVEALVARHDAITKEQEDDLLGRLARAGWEAGCWIRPDPGMILVASQQEAAEFLERMRARAGFARTPVEDDPFPNGRPCEPVEGEDPCYIVLSNRCEIVAVLKNEPLVELAMATLCTEKQRIDNAWRNSPREFPINPHAIPTHLVDLRYRFFIPKLDLDGLAPNQALPPDDQVRQRFALRAGQRYMRAAVPDKLVAKVVEPLKGILRDDTEVTNLFTEWALFHGGERDRRPGVLATYRSDIDPALDDDEQERQRDTIRVAAEDKFTAVVEALPDDAKAELDLDDDHRTRPVSEEELTVADWRLSWKLELDAESFGGDPDAAMPAR